MSYSKAKLKRNFDKASPFFFLTILNRKHVSQMFAYPDPATGFRNVYMAQFRQAHTRLFNYSKNYREIVLGIKLYSTSLLKKVSIR